MSAVSRIAAACFILALPIFLITSNVRFLASDAGYYKHGFRKFDAQQRTGIPLPELDRAADEIVNYFEDDSSTLRIIVSQDGQESSLFNARETQHMHDVKWLMQAVFRANEVSLAVVLSYVAAVFLWSRERSLRTLAVQSLAGVGVGFAVVAGIGAFALTGFDAAWTRFHEIVFSNNLWQLDPATDHLIQMFPQPFWEEATFIVGALTVAEAILVVSVSTLYLVFARERRAAEAPASAATAPVTGNPTAR